MENTEAKRSNNTNKLLVVLIALLTIACGVLAWLYINQKGQTVIVQKEKAEVTDEREAVKKELENMLSQYDMLKTDNTQLQSEIDAQREKIEQLMKDIDKYKGNTAMMIKYRKETETLRKIMQNYVVTIDSLNTLNIKLNEENTKVRTELGQQQTRYQELSAEKENLTKTVRQAAMLNAVSITNSGIYYRSGGKEMETNRAKKAEKIKTCFTVAENKITKPGPKDFYVQILTPDGKILSESTDNQFTHDDRTDIYSAKKTAEYNNQLQTICVYSKVSNVGSLPEGKYVVNVYSDGGSIGSGTFEMK